VVENISGQSALYCPNTVYICAAEVNAINHILFDKLVKTLKMGMAK